MDAKRHVPKQHKTRSQHRQVTRRNVPTVRTQDSTPSMSQEIDNGSEMETPTEIKVETPSGLYTVGQIKVEMPDYEDGHVEFKVEFPSNWDSNMETEGESSIQFYDGNEGEFPGEMESVGIKVEPQDYCEANTGPLKETFDFCDIKIESSL